MMRAGETVDQWRERMMEKAEYQRSFTAAAAKAREARHNPAKAVPAPKRKRKPVGNTIRNKRPDNCLDCGVKMYTRGEAHSEDAKVHDGKGLCTTCAARVRNDRNISGAPLKRAENCVRCNIGMFTRGGPRVEGQRRHSGRGLCTKCYSQVGRWQ